MKLCRFVFLFAALCVLTTVTLKIPESAGKDHLVSILDIRHLLHDTSVGAEESESSGTEGGSSRDTRGGMLCSSASTLRALLFSPASVAYARVVVADSMREWLECRAHDCFEAQRDLDGVIAEVPCSCLPWGTARPRWHGR